MRISDWRSDVCSSDLKSRAFASRLAGSLGIPVATAASAEEVVRRADVVVTTTPSRTPLIEADWLHPGLHITAMGSDAPDKNELAPGVVAGADRLDRKSTRLNSSH